MSPLWWIWSAFFLLECVVAIYLNSYIVFFNGRSLTEGGKRNPVSLILIIMGINNITMRCIWIVNDVAFWLTDIFDSPLYNAVAFLLGFHMYFNYWLAAWLCVYYTIFIANFSHRMFLWIKRNLLAFLNQVLFVTGVGSLAISLLALMWRCTVIVNNSANGTTIEDVSITYFYKIGAIILGSCLPFTCIAISLMVSVSSLLKHVNNLSQTGFDVQVHVTLIKSMTVFFMISVSYFLVYIINLTAVFKLKDPLHCIIWLLIVLAPTMKSIIIIQASPKMRKNFPGWFCARGTGGQ
ncbi:taste receptor type 2 member 8-like [Rana temporaria]|uniref:taste receptor type 2 member 8-like n=1 Tax=Rana temporaria TaxID=8407 RepID=UPI001AAD384A|nr:taste receptor type 2 member 8-like [Rana temporaria]